MASFDAVSPRSVNVPDDRPSASAAAVEYQVQPASYRHWKVSYDGEIAHLLMDVSPDGGLRPGYELKLNSYDLGVDIELNDIVWRTRFEHPEVRVVLLRSANERAFCAGANINMLGMSTHAWKVNFCKFTNETRCSIEDALRVSQQAWVACCNGTTAGGGYELALACKEIYLIDDGNSAVSLPEVPLLGVLPGTGGLTRLVDKRQVRRDLADMFSTTAEGVRGKRALQWGLVDGVFPRTKFDASIANRATALASELRSELRAGERKGVALRPLAVEKTDNSRVYSHVRLEWDETTRMARLTVTGANQSDVDLAGAGGEALRERGDASWALAAFRELEDAILYLRTNLLSVGLLLVRVEGDAKLQVAHDEALAKAKEHWFVAETLAFMANTLRRLDLTSRSMFALADTGSAFSGCLFELALAADRFYMRDSESAPVHIALSVLNDGALPMSHGQSRLQTRFCGNQASYAKARVQLGAGPLTAQQADAAGLVTVTLDDIDWEDDSRVAIEERASLSPDALTGMEANLRFAGPESPDSKIFARLTAWQNWIFIRPNATGPTGALTLYGQPDKPQFDWKRV